MKWKKLGQIYRPQSKHPKLISHAANPLAVPLRADLYRVFYSARDAENRSSVSFIDLDLNRLTVTYIHDRPVFEHGPEGSFYSHGVSIGNCYEANGQRYMLFMGWQNPSGGHWRGDIGRLVVHSDLSLSLDTAQPFMGIDAADPISLSYPWVIKDNDTFHMWYGSTITWDAGNQEMLHVINHASSRDGKHWQRHGCSVPYEIGKAQAFSRPSVIGSSRTGYHMWFSYRGGAGETYRIGYAHSRNGTSWNLQLLEGGIEVSADGWDSEMTEYPFVFEHDGIHYMLYNGNGYGQTGIGIAVLEPT